MPPRSSFSLVARGLTASRGSALVLDSVDVDVGPGSRLGVVGPNGVGKTTLLRLLARLDVPDAGSVTASPAGLRVGYLPQQPEPRRDETVLEFLRRRSGVAAAEAELERASGALALESHGAADAYATALDVYLAAGGPDFDARAHAALAEVGIDDAPLSTASTSTLSGGQAARVSLAALVVSRFDVYLLDE